jgi:serine/threonine-protein kinase
VFRGHDAQADRLVAIKVFRLDATPEQAAELAARLEALCARLPRHPCLVGLLAAGLEGSAAWLALDYVAADTLDARLKRRSTGGLRTALPLLSQIAEALDAAAEAGVHHGALHPRDVLVSTRLDVRVTGFGVAEALDALGLAAPVRRPYTAPERGSGAAWGRRADVFTLGVLGFELLTGRRPVGFGAAAAGLVSGVGEGVDADACRQALGRALAERAVERFERGQEFIEALAATLKEPIDLRPSRQPDDRVPAPLLATLGEVPADEPGEEADVIAPGHVAQPVSAVPERGRRQERGRGARTGQRAAPASAPIMPFEIENPRGDVPEPPPSGPAPAPWDDSPRPRFDEERDTGEGEDIGALGWRDILGARPGLVVAVLAIGVLAGLAAGYAIWGRADAPAPPPASASAPVAPREGEGPVRQQVTEPEVKAGAAAPAANPSAVPPVPREAEARRPGDTPTPSAGAASGGGRATAAATRPAERRAPPPDARRAPPLAQGPARPVGPASLEVASRPAGARVLLDGREVGRTPLRLERIAPGRHTVRLELDGHRLWETTLTVTAGQAARVAGSLERTIR